MEHPVLATDAEMDEAKEGENINADINISHEKGNRSLDKTDLSDNEDAEERALSAMSIFSHDSDDDPTWAPSETEKLKLEQKRAKIGKGGNQGAQRKGNSIFDDKASKNPVVKKGRGRPKAIKDNESDKTKSTKSSQSKNMLTDGKGRKRTPEVRISRQESKLANSEARKNKNKNRKSSNDLDASSSDEESIDLSEKANRVEGAGGNDFHYFCRICKSLPYEEIIQ